jgi:hypothetical protein
LTALGRVLVPPRGKTRQSFALPRLEGGNVGRTRNAATVALAVFVLAGVIFSTVSTYD